MELCPKRNNPAAKDKLGQWWGSSTSLPSGQKYNVSGDMEPLLECPEDDLIISDASSGLDKLPALVKIVHLVKMGMELSIL